MLDLVIDLFGDLIADKIQRKWGWLGCGLILLALIAIGAIVIYVLTR